MPIRIHMNDSHTSAVDAGDTVNGGKGIDPRLGNGVGGGGGFSYQA